MDPVTNSDRLIALLRQRLKERAVAADRGGATKRAVTPTGLDAVAAAATGDVAELRRACVQTLLSDRLGRDLLNDAQFQQVVARVTGVIAEDREASRLLDQVLADVRARPAAHHRR